MCVLQCPNCQQLQSDHAKFCANCGAQLQAPVQQPANWPAQQPVAQARTLWGLPVHIWLFAASALAVIALLMPWYSGSAYSNVSWQTTGYQYTDGTRSTWDLPSVSTTYYSGSNGLNLFTLLLSLAIGGLALKFRRSAGPRWAVWTLAGVVGLVTFIGVVNLLYDPHMGPFLYALAGGLAIPAVLRLISGSLARQF